MMHRYLDLRVWLVVLGALSLAHGCKKDASSGSDSTSAVAQQQVDLSTTNVFSPEQPFALEIARDRSFLHAKNLVVRLATMKIDSYIVYGEIEDDGGKWFRVLTGRSASTLELGKVEDSLRQTHGMPDLEFRAITDFLSPPEIVRDPKKYDESLIAGRDPAVPGVVIETMKRFPFSVDYLIESMSVMAAGASKEDSKKYSPGHRHINLDLPRGIKKSLLRELCEVYSEVVYEDNIYGDSVTINVIKLRENHGIVGDVSSHFAQRILDTGEYDVETADAISIEGSTPLQGFKVTLLTKKGELRTYFVLADPSKRWIFFSQSTKKTDEEMKKFLQMIDKSEGMLAYPEFHNTFYAIPDELGEGEFFVSFSLSRLTRSYARSKNYANWAKAYVGYWSARASFKDPKKGNWTFALYDMLRKDRREEVTQMYDKRTSVRQLDVYGTKGNIVYGRRWSRRRGRYIKTVGEINWPYDRYTVMVNNMESGWLGKESMLERANSLQLNREGGFAKRTMLDSATGGEDDAEELEGDEP